MPALLMACTIAGCGGGSAQAPETVKPAATTVPPEHEFGDYDGDDTAYKGQLGHSDGDGDDRGKATDHDNDFDGGHGYFDSDDQPILQFGRAAPPAVEREVRSLLQHYYRAAAADDGTVACGLLYTQLARTLPRDLATAGPVYLHGSTTCPAVTAKLFIQSAAQLNTYSHLLKVAAVRVAGNRGRAVLRFRGLAARQVELEREGRTWKLDALADNELP